MKAKSYPADRAYRDAALKAILLEMARRGEPRPKANTVLGRALKRFTTKPVE